MEDEQKYCGRGGVEEVADENALLLLMMLMLLMMRDDWKEVQEWSKLMQKQILKE